MNDKKQSNMKVLKNDKCSPEAKDNTTNELSSRGVSLDKINTIIKKDSRREHIDIRDIVQIIIGSMAAAIVFAPTSEIRSISLNLPIYKLVIIFILTSASVGLLAYWAGGRKLRINEMQKIAYVLPLRIILIYTISVISCLIALWLYDIITIKTNIFDVARIVIVLLLPATWGGTLIDLIYSKHR